MEIHNLSLIHQIAPVYVSFLLFIDHVLGFSHFCSTLAGVEGPLRYKIHRSSIFYFIFEPHTREKVHQGSTQTPTVQFPGVRLEQRDGRLLAPEKT